MDPRDQAGGPGDGGGPTTGAVWTGFPLSDAELLRRWHEALLGARCAARPQLRAEVGEQLLERWRESHRGYHDLEHLSDVLRALDVLAVPAGPVQLAAFFHDAVYRGEPGSDEEASALLASESLRQLLPATGAAAVARNVRSTRAHAGRNADEQALNDADLAILAAPPERYDRYLRGVRTEYARYPDDAFSSGRAVVLRDLLLRPRLFATATAHRLWEPDARANLARELARHDAS